MSKIIDFVAKFLIPQKALDGLKNVQDWMSGKKTYLAGSILILQGALEIVNQFVALGGASDILAFVKTIMSSNGMILILNGLAAMGLRAAVDKVSNG